MKLETFFKRFDLFADAPDAVAKMRGLILKLAMQGKLSNAYETDVPVSDLLCQIGDEKRRLCIKRVTKATSGNRGFFEETGTEIPARWTWARFGEIARHNAGKTLDKARNRGELRDYITTSNLYWGFFQLDEVRQMPIQDNELERCTAIKGDLLICEGGEAGRAAVWTHDYEVAFQNHVHRARFFGDINPFFVQRFFEKLNATGEIGKYRKGVGISNMSGKALASIVLPIPPLAEQKRIVEKVDELMALCDRLEAQQQKRETRHAALARASLARFADAPTPANLQFLFHKSYDITPADLRKTILSLAVSGKLVQRVRGDESVDSFLQGIWHAKSGNRTECKDIKKKQPFEIPIHWRWVALAEIADFAIGKTPPRGDAKYWQSAKEHWVSIADMEHYGTVVETKEKVSHLAAKEVFRNRFVAPGSILMSFKLTIGKIAWAGIRCFHNEAIISLHPPERELARYLWRFLPVFSELQKSNNAIKGSTLNKALLRAIPIALPPRNEQQRIVAKVDELMTIVDQLEAELLASAFKGKKLVEAAVAELTS